MLHWTRPFYRIACEKPLELSSDSMDQVKSLIVGELSASEDKLLTLVLTNGLSVGIAKDDSQPSAECSTAAIPKQETSPKTAIHCNVSTPTEHPAKSEPKMAEMSDPNHEMCPMHIKVILKKLNIGLKDSIMADQELLDSITTSKYAVITSASSMDKCADSKNMVAYSLSDETVAYWLLDKDQQIVPLSGMAHKDDSRHKDSNKSMIDCQSRQLKVVKSDKTFRLSVHGI